MLWTIMLYYAFVLFVVGDALEFRFFGDKKLLSTYSQVNCFEVPEATTRNYRKTFDGGWRSQTSAISNSYFAGNVGNKVSSNIDRSLPYGDIVKEHAKLVQDINSLRQVVFIAPTVDDNRETDYEDSIFYEIIETSTTPNPHSFTAKPIRTLNPGSMPVILVGGAGQHQIVKTQPLKIVTPTISLVGTSVSPLLSHPYPFIVQTSSRNPVKVYMSATPITTRRPTLWERLLNSIIPR